MEDMLSKFRCRVLDEENWRNVFNDLEVARSRLSWRRLEPNLPILVLRVIFLRHFCVLLMTFVICYSLFGVAGILLQLCDVAFKQMNNT